MTLLLAAALRASLILLVGLAGAALLRRRSAALRHAVLAASVAAAALVAPATSVLPSWHLDVAVAGVPAGPTAGATPSPAARFAPSLPGPVAGPAAARVLALPALVWLAGVLALGAVLIAGLVRVRLARARAIRLDDGRWARLAEQLSQAYGLRRRVVILLTDTPDLLATWGLVRPCVLLPAQARDWSDARARVVLCHELAHVRRCDVLVQVGAELLRAIYWFSPLFWVACARLRRESEQACDDEVLRAGVAAGTYATHLLEIAASCRAAHPLRAPAVPMARPSTLERRVTAMLNPALDRRSLTRRATLVSSALLLAAALPIAALQAGQGAAPLTGAVYDASGAVMPGVELTLEGVRPSALTATTDAAGRFEFAPVEPGAYVLAAALPGFRALRHPLELKAARDWDRAITLQVGELRETISVRARRPAAPAAVPASEAGPVRVGGNIRAPRKLHDVRPDYPASMREAGREGLVLMEAVIGPDGSVSGVRVVSAEIHPDFAAAAVAAVRQWRFDSTLLNGVPVEVRMHVSVDFSLADD